MTITIQLTDGGPSMTSEFPSDVAGPPFGAALLLSGPVILSLYPVKRVRSSTKQTRLSNGSRA